MDAGISRKLKTGEVATAWVDQACSAANVTLSDREQRHLIANLLAFPGLIIYGPPGVGKYRLAKALALSIAQGQRSQICMLQGHPWWAAKTGDVARYVNLQTEFSVWRLAEFVTDILQKPQLSRPPQNDDKRGGYVACIKKMSPVEVHLYFEQLLPWLRQTTSSQNGGQWLRLIGTYDSNTRPDLDDNILRLAAVLHINGAHQRYCSKPEESNPGEHSEKPLACSRSTGITRQNCA